MPDVWKPQDKSVYIGWADFIICHGKDVTKWEQTFTKDVYSQLLAGRKNLTQPQAQILERIYANKT